MHPGTFAKTNPSHAAIVTDEGRRVTYGDLDARANQVSRYLESLGIGYGDRVAILLPNGVEFLEAAWGAHRLGCYYATLNHHLLVPEISYILADCAATVLFTSLQLGDPARFFKDAPALKTVIVVGGDAPGCIPYSVIEHFSGAPLEENLDGGVMLYSSGTTGRPKGIVIPRPRVEISPPFPLRSMFERLSMDENSVYMTPAPLYHAAPSAWSMSTHRVGATLVLMTQFDATRALQLIAGCRVTHAQFVPTMFTRMLQLPEAVRSSFNLGSLRAVIHSAAPCPASVKRAMIEWWGPIIWEFYGASEGHGATMLNSEEWMSHPGSVGKPIFGEPHIVAEDGTEAPPNVIGDIYFRGGLPFKYHGDVDKTREAYNERGWARVGDRGYLDKDGFLYLADRSNDMIISGGVNIYPRDAEDALALHPLVSDVAVIGVPNAEFGEEVKALIVLNDPQTANPVTAQLLIAHCREQIAHFKCPRSIDFVAEVPRGPNGKLYRRRAREAYWRNSDSELA
ncbi:MAG TPA: AMP-binding protein [Steroidobacteraceae bacterium]|jgi:acyl-CoA synthetase (AMP-forming)/AMP-acid ligase II